jgi:hypothetical protein
MRYMVSDVMLYDEPSLRHAQSLQIRATQMLGGSSLGLGVIGSPAWVLGGALLLGGLQQLLDHSKAKEGVVQLQHAQKMTDIIRDKGELVPIEKIENIRYPIPGLWRATSKRKQNDSIHDLAHNGDPFVQARTTDGAVLFIGWDKVEQYAMQQLISL